MALGDRRYIVSGVLIGIVAGFLGLTYGKWEYQSWRHSNEFSQALKQEINAEKTASLVSPAYLKVVNYSRWGAQVLMQEQDGGQQVMLLFTRNKEDQWLLVKWDWCSVSAGCPLGCFFPWYGAIDPLFCLGKSNP